MRLNRYIAACTKYSRRQADDLIKQGRIKVNSRSEADLSFQVNLSDKILLDNQELTPYKKIYYILNKPVGVVVSKAEKHAKKLVIDFVPKNPPVFPVGRLDKYSEGLIILTNDGALAQELIHPKYKHEKEYLAVLKNELTSADFTKLVAGIELFEGRACFDKIKRVKANTYRVVIHQGWNRQIRRMFETVGNEVVDLKRIRIAGIRLGGLPVGQWVEISQAKIYQLIK